MNDASDRILPVSKRLVTRKNGLQSRGPTPDLHRVHMQDTGFFYRVFMSRDHQRRGTGDSLSIWCTPIFGICLLSCAGSIQTALSQYVAANQTRGRAVFRTVGLVIASGHVLSPGLGHRPVEMPVSWQRKAAGTRCAPCLPVMAVSVPSAGLTRLYQRLLLRHAESPCPRLFPGGGAGHTHGAPCSHRQYLADLTPDYGVSLAYTTHLIGEMASPPCSLCSALASSCASKDGIPAALRPSPFFGANRLRAPLMALALPFRGNRLILNVLGSAEAI